MVDAISQIHARGPGTEFNAMSGKKYIMAALFTTVVR